MLVRNCCYTQQQRYGCALYISVLPGHDKNFRMCAHLEVPSLLGSGIIIINKMSHCTVVFRMYNRTARSISIIRIIFRSMILEMMTHVLVFCMTHYSRWIWPEMFEIRNAPIECSSSAFLIWFSLCVKFSKSSQQNLHLKILGAKSARYFHHKNWNYRPDGTEAHDGNLSEMTKPWKFTPQKSAYKKVWNISFCVSA